MIAPHDRATHLEPGKLWSLWSMLSHEADAFCRFSSMIGQMLVVLETGHSPNMQTVVETLASLQRESHRLGLRSVVQHLDRIKEQVTTYALPADKLRPMIVELYNRLQDTLSERLFLMVEAKDHDLYAPSSEPLFGAMVDTKFPSLIYDVEECGKCLALDRSTAAAYHAIRCLEAGIRAIARSLGIPDPTRGADRSWANMLRDIKAEIDRRWPSSTGRMSGDAKLFDEAYAALAGMQNPYRNSTMHLDDKYTPDEARHIFAVVKGFMETLANRMDENGLPVA